MPLTVVSFATYLTSIENKWRDGDYSAHKFIKAVKAQPFKYSAHVPVLGTLYYLDQNNSNDALGWFAQMATAYVREKKTPGPAVLVPLPNSRCTVSNGVLPRTLAQAQALAANLRHTTVLDCLRWKVEKPSASGGGGTRKPQALYNNLALTAPVPQGPKLIIIDDVRTTGGHLKAARATLLGQHGKCDLAICAGRTVQDQGEEPFSRLEEEIDDWWPMPSFFSFG